MPGIVRVDQDKHAGHASPSPGAFHQTAYATGSSDTFCNSTAIVKIGDTTYCGDPASGGSGNVFINGIGVHRNGDGTDGHASWVPNSASSGSGNTFANGE